MKFIMVGDQQWTIWTFLIITMQILCWVSATSRQLPGQAPYSLQTSWKLNQDYNGEMRGEELNRVGRLGSKPPSCENKCGICNPCEAIQVPTTTDHFGVAYANYEPEGWKCKCGESFFNP